MVLVENVTDGSMCVVYRISRPRKFAVLTTFFHVKVKALRITGLGIMTCKCRLG